MNDHEATKQGGRGVSENEMTHPHSEVSTPLSQYFSKFLEFFGFYLAPARDVSSFQRDFDAEFSSLVSRCFCSSSSLPPAVVSRSFFVMLPSNLRRFCRIGGSDV